MIGVSSETSEAAARNAVETAARTVRGLCVAEVIREDVTIENGSIINFRVRLGISFKYETEQGTGRRAEAATQQLVPCREFTHPED